jgi:acyl-coenzyme A thioesterase PaaI-like protein
MTDQTDLIIPLSELTFEGEGTARIAAASEDTLQIGSLLQYVIQRHAASELKDGEPFTVSVTFDVSAPAKAAEMVSFESRIDRRTRTLIFASGTATQDGRHLLKATVVFRIS